jgi:DNA-binding MarR family transcriptional regulator
LYWLFVLYSSENHSAYGRCHNNSEDNGKDKFWHVNAGKIKHDGRRGQLATALRVTPANVTGIVDRLVEHKLISRSENVRDRRMLLLKTTERSYMAEVLTHLNINELDTLAKGLTSLTRAIDAHQGEK